MASIKLLDARLTALDTERPRPSYARHDRDEHGSARPIRHHRIPAITGERPGDVNDHSWPSAPDS
jgi:hypothetical protein